jgi:hypothetical protein
LPPGPSDEVLEALAASGEISRAAQPKDDWSWRSKGLGLGPWHRPGLARRTEGRPKLTRPTGHGAALYLNTSLALRASVERGTIPDIEARMAAAPMLVTSRLSLVKPARALIRLRQQGRVVAANRLADARREVDALWTRWNCGN